MTDTPKMTRRWGYKVGDAQIFVLPEGADLPEGWVSSPALLPTLDVDEPETASDGSDWEQLFIAADTRAKSLEMENASLKEEISALLDQMSSAEAVPQDDPDLTIPHPGAAPEDGFPANWRELHHSTRIRMAKEIAPDLADLISNAKEADEVLAKHEEDLNG